MGGDAVRRGCLLRWFKASGKRRMWIEEMELSWPQPFTSLPGPVL